MIGKKITEVWAFVITEDDGGEGIPAFKPPMSVMMMPLVCADQERVESLMPIAQHVADSHGKELRILKFSQLEQVGTITPREQKQ